VRSEPGRWDSWPRHRKHPGGHRTAAPRKLSRATCALDTGDEAALRQARHERTGKPSYGMTWRARGLHPPAQPPYPKRRRNPMTARRRAAPRPVPPVRRPYCRRGPAPRGV